MTSKFGKRLSDFVNMFKFIQEEIQISYLPDFIDLETFQFVEKIAQMEGRIDELKRIENEGDDEDNIKSPGSKRENILPHLDNDQEDDGDYLKNERKDITDLLRTTSFGFSQTKKKSNEEILKRVAATHQYEDKMKQIKRSTLQIYTFRKVPQGKGKPPKLQKDLVRNEYERAPPLDLKKITNESNISRIGKKKKLRYQQLSSDEIFQLSEQIEILKKKQIARIYRSFDAKPISERNVRDTKILLSLLFGRRNAEVILEKFLRDKQVPQLDQLNSHKRGENTIKSKIVGNITAKISLMNMESLKSKMSKSTNQPHLKSQEEPQSVTDDSF